MVKSDGIFVSNVVPVFGGLVAFVLFSSPVMAVRYARSQGSIGDLNPIPFVFIAANCAAWSAYSFVIEDWFLFVPNAVGFMVGATFFLGTYGLAMNSKRRDKLGLLALGLMVVILVVAGVERLVLSPRSDTAQSLWGFTANTILVFFYMSPLSDLLHVIKTRNSASLNLPLSVMSIANGGLWFVYGLAFSDPFIWAPNAFGTVMGVIQTLLRLMFAPPRIAKNKSEIDIAANARMIEVKSPTGEINKNPPTVV